MVVAYSLDSAFDYVKNKIIDPNIKIGISRVLRILETDNSRYYIILHPDDLRGMEWDQVIIQPKASNRSYYKEIMEFIREHNAKRK